MCTAIWSGQQFPHFNLNIQQSNNAYLNHVSHVLYMLRKFLQFLILCLQLAYLLIFGLNVFVELSEVKKKK